MICKFSSSRGEKKEKSALDQSWVSTMFVNELSKCLKQPNFSEYTIERKGGRKWHKGFCVSTGEKEQFKQKLDHLRRRRRREGERKEEEHLQPLEINLNAFIQLLIQPTSIGKV